MSNLSTNITEETIHYFNIYPNPATQEITLNIGAQIKNNLVAKIYSITGQVVLIKNINNASTTINTLELSKGYYIVELSGENGFATREKLIIK